MKTLYGVTEDGRFIIEDQFPVIVIDEDGLRSLSICTIKTVFEEIPDSVVL